MSKSYSYIQDGLTDSSFSPMIWWGIIIIIILVGSVLYSFNRFTVVSVNENLSDIGPDVFLKYLFIIVAVERAAAVFVGFSRGQKKVDWSLRINRISEVLQKDSPHTAVLKQVYAREHRLVKQLEQSNTIGTIDDVPEYATDEAYLGYLTSAKHAYEFQRAQFDSITNRYVARIVFFAGIILATLGLSIFQDLFQCMDLVSAMKIQIDNNVLVKVGIEWQTGLLRFSDILVTGGLLGGGSAGLNTIATKMTEFLNKP